jgi:hypothetical protein
MALFMLISDVMNVKRVGLGDFSSFAAQPLGFSPT